MFVMAEDIELHAILPGERGGIEFFGSGHHLDQVLVAVEADEFLLDIADAGLARQLLEMKRDMDDHALREESDRRREQRGVS